MQVWREFNDHCHVATYVCMTARFPVDELYFQRQLRLTSYQQAIAKALFIGDVSEDYFRITVVSITQVGNVRHESRSCSSQGVRLGEFVTPDSCSTAARASGCTTFMYSSRYPSWGCRCCSDPDPGIEHALWNVYNVKLAMDDEIAVHFRVQAPDANAPSDAASPALAAPVPGKMTVSVINSELTLLGLVKALDITGADICNKNSFSGIHGPHARAPSAPAPRSCLPGPRPAAAVGHACGTRSSLCDC